MFEDPYGILQLSATKKIFKSRKKIKHNKFENIEINFFQTINNKPMDIIFEKYWERCFAE